MLIFNSFTFHEYSQDESESPPIEIPTEPKNAKAYYFDLAQMPNDMDFPSKERNADFPYYKSEDIPRMVQRVGRTNKEIFGSGRASNIGAIFEGYIEFPADGYKLCLRAADASELYLDDVFLGIGKTTSARCFDVEDSSPGVVRRIEMRYKNMNPNSNVIRLDWKPPGGKSITLSPYDFLPAPVSFIHMHLNIRI